MSQIYGVIAVLFSFYGAWFYMPDIYDVGFFSKLFEFLLGSILGYAGSFIGSLFNGFSFGALGPFVATIFGSAAGCVIVMKLFG